MTRNFILKAVSETTQEISFSFPDGESRLAGLEDLSKKLDSLAADYEKASNPREANSIRLLWLGGFSIYRQIRATLAPSLPVGALTHKLCSEDPQSSAQA